jgi:ATP phosphoribosyltransferase
LKSFLRGREIESEIIEISGSVEIAPTLGVADAICDLVSTGSTLRTNGLVEIECLYQSESVIVQSSKPLSEEKQSLVDRLLRRINGVMRASCNKYIMMNAPRSALAVIRDILPGMEEPSVLPFACSSDRVAIHTVCDENVFWETMERLKAAGASSILVMPIEKILS